MSKPSPVTGVSDNSQMKFLAEQHKFATLDGHINLHIPRLWLCVGISYTTLTILTLSIASL